MKVFKYIALSVTGLSIAGFIWLGVFLVTTPASHFDTQGPGLFGAFLLFSSQVIGAIGIVLLVIWKVISLWLRYRVNNVKRWT